MKYLVINIENIQNIFLKPHLNKMPRLSWISGISLHYIRIHKSPTPKQAKATRTAQYTPHHVLCCLL